MSDQFQGIQVNGMGKISVKPDFATIVLGVLAEDKTAAAALAANTKKMSEVVKSLTASGVDSKDVQTSNFSVQAKYKYPKTGNPSLIGYQVSNNVVLKVRNLDDFGKVLDSAIASGANQVDSISFGAEKSVENEATVLKAAMADARAKAQLLAEQDGVQLGVLVSCVASANRPVPQAHRAMAFAADASGGSAPPISAGELDMTATVTAVYSIESSNP